MVRCPKSHLEDGRLYLTLKSRKDPVAAVYHFRRYLLLESSSREAPKVKQLIESAEKEIIRNLPGKPYAGYLNGLTLQEENLRLMREVADLKARIGLPLSETLKPVQNASTNPVSASPSETFKYFWNFCIFYFVVLFSEQMGHCNIAVYIILYRDPN